MTASGDILRKAASVVDGPRNDTHGNKEKTFAQIAELVTTYLNARGLLPKDKALAPRDVTQIMVLIKIIRSANGKYNDDDYLDQAGYSGISGELAADEVMRHDRGANPEMAAAREAPGYKTPSMRPGVEMNLTSTPGVFRTCENCMTSIQCAVVQTCSVKVEQTLRDAEHAARRNLR
jgi:hypothetical protein